MKKFASATFILIFSIVCFLISGCGKNLDSSESKVQNASKTFNVGMVTDGNSISDESFNQSTWKGLSDFSAKTGANVSYIESVQSSDYSTNLNKYADENVDLIWGVGFKIADALLQEAENNPDQSYGIVDYSYSDKIPKNVTCLEFKDNESAFLGGVAAAMTTKTGKVGFIGGMKSEVIDRFEYGFVAGVNYISKLLHKNIKVQTNYLESFTDTAKAKATAIKMFSDGADVIFHASGGAGVGIIEAAKESKKFAIGADMDQAYLAPENVLCSVIKKVDKAVEQVTTKMYNSEEIGGISLTMGLAEECVGLTDNNPNMSNEALKMVKETTEKIKNGKINPPQSQSEYKSWQQSELNSLSAT